MGVQGETGIWHYTAARWREAWMVWRAAPVLYSALTFVPSAVFVAIDVTRNGLPASTLLFAAGMAAELALILLTTWWAFAATMAALHETPGSSLSQLPRLLHRGLLQSPRLMLPSILQSLLILFALLLLIVPGILLSVLLSLTYYVAYIEQPPKPGGALARSRDLIHREAGWSIFVSGLLYVMLVPLFMLIEALGFLGLQFIVIPLGYGVASVVDSFTIVLFYRYYQDLAAQPAHTDDGASENFSQPPTAQA